MLHVVKAMVAQPSNGTGGNIYLPKSVRKKLKTKDLSKLTMIELEVSFATVCPVGFFLITTLW
jgi:hypothetical protein